MHGRSLRLRRFLILTQTLTITLTITLTSLFIQNRNERPRVSPVLSETGIYITFLFTLLQKINMSNMEQVKRTTCVDYFVTLFGLTVTIQQFFFYKNVSA
jgi:hypothetical protein